jgi:hypothetical protein
MSKTSPVFGYVIKVGGLLLFGAILMFTLRDKPTAASGVAPESYDTATVIAPEDRAEVTLPDPAKSKGNSSKALYAVVGKTK